MYIFQHCIEICTRTLLSSSYDTLKFRRRCVMQDKPSICPRFSIVKFYNLFWHSLNLLNQGCFNHMQDVYFQWPIFSQLNVMLHALKVRRYTCGMSSRFILCLSINQWRKNKLEFSCVCLLGACKSFMHTFNTSWCFSPPSPHFRMVTNNSYTAFSPILILSSHPYAGRALDPRSRVLGFNSHSTKSRA